MTSHLANPEVLEVQVYHGAEGSFLMVEDDCSGRRSSPVAKTRFTYTLPGETETVFRMELEGAPPPRILGGVLEEDCAALLREFFLLQRRRDTGGTPAGAPRAPARKPGKIPKKHP